MILVRSPTPQLPGWRIWEIILAGWSRRFFQETKWVDLVVQVLKVGAERERERVAESGALP